MRAADGRFAPRWRRVLVPLAFAGLCAHVPAPAAAETAYVIDRLLVGVHAEKNLDSAIVKVLPTGTTLEVLERDGELARVQDEEGVTGWVDAAYLSSDEPAQLRLAALEAEKQALEARLDALREQAATGEGTADAELATRLETVTRENTELKAKLSDERLRAGQLNSEVAQLRAELRAQATPPDARLIAVERERDALERALAGARKEVAELTARASTEATAAMVPLVVKEYALLIALLLGLLVAGAFGAGMYVLDRLNRRRHGGFRV